MEVSTFQKLKPKIMIERTPKFLMPYGVPMLRRDISANFTTPAGMF
jgi:hypothetical protein